VGLNREDGAKSGWDCTLENSNLRLGLRYVKGVRAEAGVCLLRERERAPFADIDDLARRVPELRKDEMSKLAATGALNPLDALHRRDALWKSSRAARDAGPLLAGIPETDPGAPLRQMTLEERLDADYGGTGVNIGLHPMAHRRAEMDALGVTRAADLQNMSEMFDEHRLTIVSNRWLMVEGPVQNVDNVIHVRAKPVTPLDYGGVSAASHDFH
jgi:error-prone DNA polymerase